MCSPVGTICLPHGKAARSLPRGQGRRGEKGAPGEPQIINNHFSCCRNSGIKPGRTVGAEEGPHKRVPVPGLRGGGTGVSPVRGGQDRSVPGPWGAGQKCPRSEGGRTGVSPARGRCRGSGRRRRLQGAPGVVGTWQGPRPVPASGPTGRKSLPACGGDSLAERAPPAVPQIS